MNILVLNCGSSSLKYQLINMDDESVIAKGLVERIGIEGSILTHKPTGKDKYVVETPMKDHNIAVKLVLDALMDAEHGVIKSTDEIAAVGHRVLHAGEKYIESCIVTEDVKKVVRECFDLGPLHNPANLIGIEAVEAAMPGKPNVAVWDTAFGGTMEPKAYLYAIPREYYEKYGVRRYGFHGTSHSFVSKETIKFANLNPETAKVIVCHLGNGASISASIGGKCVDTLPKARATANKKQQSFFNDAYNAAEEEAATMAAALPSDPKQLVKDAYFATWAEVIRNYAGQRAAAGTSDAVIRDYLGAQGK